MKKPTRPFMVLIVVLLAISCSRGRATTTPRPTDTPMVSVSDIEQDPELFRDKLVRIRGYGVAMATLPLCEGYVGQDKRVIFTDAENNSIVAELAESSPRLYHDDSELRLFEGYVRVFEGQLGCPGETKMETFPYFEIVGVE